MVFVISIPCKREQFQFPISTHHPTKTPPNKSPHSIYNLHPNHPQSPPKLDEKNNPARRFKGKCCRPITATDRTGSCLNYDLYDSFDWHDAGIKLKSSNHINHPKSPKSPKTPKSQFRQHSPQAHNHPHIIILQTIPNIM